MLHIVNTVYLVEIDTNCVVHFVEISSVLSPSFSIILSLFPCVCVCALLAHNNEYSQLLAVWVYVYMWRLYTFDRAATTTAAVATAAASKTTTTTTALTSPTFLFCTWFGLSPFLLPRRWIYAERQTRNEAIYYIIIVTKKYETHWNVYNNANKNPKHTQCTQTFHVCLYLFCRFVDSLIHLHQLTYSRCDLM